MAYEALDPVAAGEAGRASWANQVADNFADHETRIGDAETSISDHETRLDAVEANPALLRATVTLTDAQIKALPTTGIQIIAAPSANTRVKLLAVTYSSRFASGAYTNVNTTSAELYLQTSDAVKLGGYLANDSGVSLTSLTTLLASTSVLTVDLGTYATVTGTYVQPLLTGATANVNAKAVQIKATNNGAGNFTGGNASNQLIVIAYYALETVPT